MSSFSQIVVIVASGPGIGAPVMERFTLWRGVLPTDKEEEIDRLIADTRALETGDALPKFALRDGPHASHLTFEMDDDLVHSIAFVPGLLPAALQQFVDIVVAHGASEPI
ncbi:hypothetical protein K9U40_03940 [Xanthobacter autotrophicus]|uniref:hypothetical protein n=1 Tax=Xanthobacter TaxID=279 RepID=UPI0024AC0DC0|nr:hypothetical protein [Xanthobacter autotrophicus]MDI4663490.1 hypothetical protein [Xanthobacter autotrophicus]